MIPSTLKSSIVEINGTGQSAFVSSSSAVVGTVGRPMWLPKSHSDQPSSSAWQSRSRMRRSRVAVVQDRDAHDAADGVAEGHQRVGISGAGYRVRPAHSTPLGQ